MANADSRIRQLSDSAWHCLEQTVESFERAWAAGERPALDKYLAEGDSLRPALTFELASSDLEYRLRAGEDARVEDYFSSLPELRADCDLAVDLILSEYRGRGICPDVADYTNRFPDLSSELAERLREFAVPAAQSTPSPGDTSISAQQFDAPPSIEGYTILGLLGRGGMGIVYQARHAALNRVVALKIIRGDSADATLLTRFRTEASAIARLQHPNIVQIHDVVMDPIAGSGTTPYLTMEYVAGGSLAKRLADAPMLPAVAANLVTTLARATHAAHQAGILHRDLKPANVLLTADGTPKIADFGLAKPLDDTTGQTCTGDVIGTPAYMAPEQTARVRSSLGPATDVYALGAILYEALAGRPPFFGSTALEVLDQVRALEPVPPRDLRPQVPADLQTICLKCLAKEPARRFASAAALADDLARFAAGRPIIARPASAWERSWKWVRRRPAAATALAVSIAALVAITGVAVGFSLRLKAQRDVADLNYRQARAAVESYLDNVTDNPDLKLGNFHALRKQLLSAALPFYEEFAQQKTDDRAVRVDQGWAYWRLAKVRTELAEYEAALRDYDSAREIFTVLIEQFPAERDFRVRLAATNNNTGNLLEKMDRFAEAETALRRAVADRLLIVGSNTSDPNPRGDLAISYNNLGTTLTSLGKRDDALAAFAQALAIGEPLASEFPAQPEFRMIVVRSHLNRGSLLLDEKAIAEAEASYGKALAAQEQVIAEHPAVADYRFTLGRLHNSRGSCLSELNKIAEAKAAHGAALVVLEKLVDEFRSVPAFRAEFASTLHNMGNLLARTGKNAEAEACFRRAISERERLTAENPAIPAYRASLSLSLNSLANTLRMQGRRADAEGFSRKCLAIQKQLVADFPDVEQHRINLAGNSVNFGMILNDNGDSQAALEYYARAIELLEPLQSHKSPLNKHRLFLRNAYMNRAWAFMNLKRYKETVADWDHAIPLDEGPTRPAMRMQRALALAHAGRANEAVAEADALIQSGPANGAMLFLAGCVYGISASEGKNDPLTPQFAAKAVVLLRRSYVAGYLGNRERIDHLKTDDGLAALRPREDFQHFMSEVESSLTQQRSPD